MHVDAVSSPWNMYGMVRSRTAVKTHILSQRGQETGNFVLALLDDLVLLHDVWNSRVENIHPSVHG